MLSLLWQTFIFPLRSHPTIPSREGQAAKDQEKAVAMAIRRQRGLHIQKEAFVDEAISTLEGTAAGDMLDFLSKELIRLQVT